MAEFEDVDGLLRGLDPIDTSAIVGRDHRLGFEAVELAVEVAPEGDLDALVRYRMGIDRD